MDNNKNIVRAIYWTGYALCLGLDLGGKITANPEALEFFDFALSLFGALSSWFGVGVHCAYSVYKILEAIAGL